jgi:hypothetical protein
MLSTQNTTEWTLEVDIFGYQHRPCRLPQETIYDYHMDGRPLFQWERLRQRWAFQEDPEIFNYCENCPMNIFGTLEGCQGGVENLDIFFRALNELTPESPWCKVPRDGTAIHLAQVQELTFGLEQLRELLGEKKWPVAVPKVNGQSYAADPEQEGDSVQFYAWNGEGPPGLLCFNEGYTLYLSRHGLLVKPSGEDPIPHVFKRLWREGRGVFGLTSSGQTIGFQMTFARYPTWVEESLPGSELVIEEMAASRVFADVLDLLEVFCGVALEFETGILIRSA